MLTSNDLKNWLHKKISRQDKLLLILISLGNSASVEDIKKLGRSSGLTQISKWNISSYLYRSNGKAINIKKGYWELTDMGKDRVREIITEKNNPAVAKVISDLREILKEIKNKQTRIFLEEAIACHEYGLYRSAIVMSWLVAVHILHQHVSKKNILKKFNTEGRRRIEKINANTKNKAKIKEWKTINSIDGLSRIKETEFLDMIESIEVIDKSVKNKLKECLDSRNDCSHPNKSKVGINLSAAHIESLILNVFERFKC